MKIGEIGEKSLVALTELKSPQLQSPVETATEEVRFAVVMYGGISLAIYMNGIAQELLHLVRSTSPDPINRKQARVKLTPTEKVYRKLGQMLASGENLPDIPTDNSPLQIRTRFVIDILSGSSAGGINAVFLAKALANDQSLDKLKDLWVTQGDVGKLLNDQGMAEGNNLKPPPLPPSLLSGQRIYLELVRAMEGMDKDQPVPESTKSPNVGELDLFVTATDIEGQVINLQLSDKSVTELRHRNLFHFSYAAQEQDPEPQVRNDFIRENNPFLAFAARCTSAHPAAFNTMSLGDIGPVLQSSIEFRELPNQPDFEKWQKFYADYLRPQFNVEQEKQDQEARQKTHDELVKEFLKRNFNDGGVLDNQPFGPTLDTLPLHSADVPVTRKLVYIEPAPEHPELRAEKDGPPDFVENAWLSLSTLPRYEPIRQHLQKVLERNRLVERIQHITEGIEQDVEIRYRGQERTPPLTAKKFADLDIVDMIIRNGVGWGGNQRLRVAEVTDDLTLLITRFAGFDERSDEFQAIRYVVRYWRMKHYSPYKPGRKDSDEGKTPPPNTSSPKLTENKFLVQFDLLWRLRRLRFVLNKIDDLACFDARGAEVMKSAEVAEAVQYPRFDSESSVESQSAEGDEKDSQAEKDKKDKKVRQAQSDFREALIKIKSQLSEVYRRLRARRQQIWSGRLNSSAPDSENVNISGLEAALADKPSLAERKEWLKKNFPARGQRDKALLLLVSKKIADLKIPRDALLSLLENFPSEEKRDESLEDIVEPRKKEFQAFVDALDLALDDVMAAASIRCNQILHIDGSTGLPLKEEKEHDAETPVERTVRKAASHYYRYFDNYDVIAHPLLYATEVGDEIDFIEVFRISPEDAPSIIDETETSMREQNIHKLAGTKLSNFGGFFKEEFRRNDILWGRLDGAERIIAALLPGPESDKELTAKRKGLIKEAHQAIIKEELGVEDESELLCILKQLPRERQESLKETLQDERVQFALGTFLRGQSAVEYFKEQFLLHYEDNFKFDNQDIIVDAARGSKVFGKMLEGYADKHQIKNKRLTWVTRLTQVFYGLVQVAIPDSIPNLIVQYWLQLLYLFEFLTILLGTLFVNPNMQHFGLLAFGLTVVLNGAELLIQDLMKGRHRWLNFVIAAFIAIVFTLTVIGLAFVIGLSSEIVWNRLARLKEWYSSGPSGLWSSKTLVWGVVALLALGFFLRSVRKSKRKRNDGLDKSEAKQKKNSKSKATAESRRGYIVAGLFAFVFIASVTTLFINYQSSITGSTTYIPLSSDASMWISGFSALVSAIGTVATIIFNQKRDKREEEAAR